MEDMGFDPNTLGQLEALLEFYHANDVNCALHDRPCNQFDAFQQGIKSDKRPENRPRGAPIAPAPAVSVSPKFKAPSQTSSKQAADRGTVLPTADTVNAAQHLAKTADTLAALRDALLEFEGCNLKRTAKNIVFGRGNPDAQIMLVGEMPDQDEDRQGRAFVGSSGALLGKMLAAIGYNRDQDTYLAPLIPWRPPGRRAPNQHELALCLPFIERQIYLVRPRVLLLLGSPAAKHLLNLSHDIVSLRSECRIYRRDDLELEAFTTFHPNYLLRQPAQKRLAWQDLLRLKAHLDMMKL